MSTLNNDYFGMKKEQYDKLMHRIMFDTNFPLSFPPPPEWSVSVGKTIKQMIADKIIKSISLNSDQTLNIIYY
tara:strand:+ start:1265 stop:1483 length:219 start_codon:yes stop_codon:yes gene_type:complete